MKRVMTVICTLAFCCVSFAAQADETGGKVRELGEALKIQSQRLEEQQKALEAIREELEKQKQAEAPQEDSQATSKISGFFGGSFLSNPNISLVVSMFGYGSNLKNSELENRGISGFTTQGIERRQGFNFDAAELAIFAPVDPYFNLYTNIPITDSGISVEEAYFVTTSLPEGFQVKGGRFKSNFSRLDAQHPHAWDFADMPLPYRAFLGDEGLWGEMGSGLQTCKVMPLPNEDLIIGSKAPSAHSSSATHPPVTVGPATATHTVLPTDNPNFFP